MPASEGRRRSSRTTANGRRTHAILDTLFREIEQQCRDSGLSHRAVAGAAGLDPGYVSQLLAGRRSPSVATLVALTTALGSELSVRSYPSAGPVIRDRHQARIAEELMVLAHPSWQRYVEVAVRRPARGFIDLVFDGPASGVIVATEVQSRIDRLEQLLRWAQDKAASLPSTDLWPRLIGDREIARLLVIRSTSATRSIARAFDSILAAAYPASPRAIYESLRDGTTWPGNGILWADVHGEVVRILDHSPRGVRSDAAR